MGQGPGDATTGHLWAIDPDECRRLLADAGVGRVCWQAGPGLTVLPVAYGVHDDGRLGFRAADGSILAALAAAGPVDVAFEVDDLDAATLTGWSVLVRGSATAWRGEFPAGLCRPWAPGERSTGVQITPQSYSGRIVSGDDGQQGEGT
nr:pyridoxamine 5'-phosphate oxidase family protein [Propionibacterium sp.]